MTSLASNERGLLDPEIAEFVRRVNADYAARIGMREISIKEGRAIAELVREPWRAGGPPMETTEDLAIGSSQLRIRIYRPDIISPSPTLVYLHGGGWTNFSLDTHDRLMREYAARAECAVVGVDYSLSPEARFPVALEEVAQVLAWLRAEGEEHGLDAARLAIGGDSAGANLALASMMRARDRGEPQVRAMLLNYGAYGRDRRESHDRFGGPDFMLTPEEMDWFWTNYLGEQPVSDPLATPVQGSFEELPAAFLCIAQCDILADENLEVARKLGAAGCNVVSEVYPGATHSFLEAVSMSALADQAIEDAARWLKAVLAE